MKQKWENAKPEKIGREDLDRPITMDQLKGLNSNNEEWINTGLLSCQLDKKFKGASQKEVNQWANRQAKKLMHTKQKDIIPLQAQLIDQGYSCSVNEIRSGGYS